MDIYAVRRKRLGELADAVGSQAKLADLIGRQPSQVSSILSGAKRLGEQLAREVERRAHKPLGWLDSAEGEPASTAGIIDVSPTALLIARRIDALPPRLKNSLNQLVVVLLESLKIKTEAQNPEAERSFEMLRVRDELVRGELVHDGDHHTGKGKKKKGHRR